MLSQKNKKVNAYTDIWLKLAKKIQNLTSDLQHPTHGDIYIPGPPNDTAKTFILSQLLTPLANDNRVIFWLTKDDKEAKSIYENLKFWKKNAAGAGVLTCTNDNIGANIPVHPTNKGHHSGAPKNRRANDEKIHLLNPENKIQLSIINYQLSNTPQTHQIIVAVTNHLQYLSSHQSFVNIKTSQALNPQTLSQKLSLLGYERNTTADQPGTFAIHGEIIQIWTPQLDKPVKIELEYEKVARINLGKRQVKKIDIIPLTSPPTGDLCPFGTSPVGMRPKGDNLAIVSSDPDKQTLTRLTEAPKIIFDSLPGSKSQNLKFTPAPIYHNNLSAFTSDLKKYQNKNYKIIIATNQKKSLKQLLKEKNIRLPDYSITGLPDYSITGFVSQSPKILFLTDSEIFGKTELSKASKKQYNPTRRTASPVGMRPKGDNLAIQQLNNIKESDFVVHEDHGIAVYRGTTMHSIDNIPKEFLVLEYKAGDKLYVPIELADKIDKYIGLANPPIHRLHGSMWYQITKKIKEQAEITAKELLDLYAQREIAKATAFKPKTPEEQELENSFPYEETPDQLQTIREVENDLIGKSSLADWPSEALAKGGTPRSEAEARPMDRLVCGDVGFGKTEVAIRAAFKAVMNGKQVALLAPTTILAQQHYDTFISRLKNFPVNIEVLSRFKSKSAQKKVISQTQKGLIDILIGTHRLLSKDIQFKNLGLIIIDEEQRFGVEHKEKLKKLRINAPVLTLTATPIPRTLNLALSSLRDISIIQTPPPGRQKIKTIIEQYNEDQIKKAIKQELARSGQIYFVHNQVETIKFAAKKIRQLVPRAKIGLAHGQLKESELAQVMSKFDNGKIDILVCSTIIENGLDLANVNTLIVDNATKFGLASLYQLRGRVGRSPRQAYAYFFYHRLNDSVSSPLPKEGIKERVKKQELGQNIPPCQPVPTRSEPVRRSEVQGREGIKSGEGASGLTPRELSRLQALKQAEELGSGFQLALRDLEIRGVGNILGKKQHGAVAAIGLSLYTRLLANAVEEQKTGVKPQPIPDITIDLPLELGLPKELEPSEPKRLNLYQRLASIPNLNELAKIRKQLTRQFIGGKAMTKLQNLFDILEIKLLAQLTNIIAINSSFGLSIDGTRKKKLNLKFNPVKSSEAGAPTKLELFHGVNQKKFQKLLSTQKYWKQAGNQIKIGLEDLGKDWVGKLKEAIRVFT